MNDSLKKTLNLVQSYQPLMDSALKEAGKILVGQAYLLERLLMGLLLEGHILVEGVPGLAKTTAVKSLAKVVGAKFQRLQFTPDLLPADLMGTQIYSPKTQEFSVKKGPIFANIILADEINRAPAKVQSALLEAMQERQVTIGEQSFKLDSPFVVLATQNPIEQEGTYPLPEAQVDRFLLKLHVAYPSVAEEQEIMDKALAQDFNTIEAKLNPEDLKEIQKLIYSLYVDPKLKDYIVRIVDATRRPQEIAPEVAPYIQFGASPRGSIGLNLAARAKAFLEGRAFVTPQDVKSMAPDVLRHRLLLNYVAEAEEMTSDKVLEKILEKVEVP